MPKRGASSCECDGCKGVNSSVDDKHDSSNSKCHCNGCKKDNFIHYAQNRTNRVINGIRSIGHLSNRSHYNFEEKEANQMVQAIREELREVERKFKVKNKKVDKGFEFKSRALLIDYVSRTQAEE